MNKLDNKNYRDFLCLIRKLEVYDDAIVSEMKRGAAVHLWTIMGVRYD